VIKETPVNRFWKFVNKTESCWLWTGRVDKDGYGSIGIGSTRDKTKKCVRAHRFSYELHNGSIPDGLLVLHECDVPACVRPDHLFIGTQLDNIHDCIAKGRRCSHIEDHWARKDSSRISGENHYGAKLTEESVRQMRAMYADGLTHEAIAKHFGATRRNVCDIVRLETWKHVT
jgi:hypothetical protein